MLVLTRKRGETIRIGNDVVIKVLRTGTGAIKLGIEAPRDVTVLRGELTEHDRDRKPHCMVATPPTTESERRAPAVNVS